jgi:hypothetical protein
MRNNLEKRAADPPPLAPARLQQGRWIWDSASPLVVSGGSGDPPGRGVSARSDPAAPHATLGAPRKRRGADGGLI